MKAAALSLTLAVLLTIPCGANEETTAHSLTLDDYVLVEVSFEWGYALFRQCDLTLLLPQYGGPAKSHLHCVRNTTDYQELQVKHGFTLEETIDLRRMVIAADLFNAPHVGKDTRSCDGGLTILTVSTSDAAAAIVISHNPSFEAPGPRKQLSDWLTTHHRVLWQGWFDDQRNASPVATRIPDDVAMNPDSH